MNSVEWLALAQEYYDLASNARKNWNLDAAAYWRKAGDAAKEAARKAEQEKHERTNGTMTDLQTTTQNVPRR